ncbi:macrophage mannose receptor 1-like [Paramisgurnus dabryanus]|uniref:macrophage mannose receptor 1-like n=1 Tax=Paramisgurnus dabryanus TaxID=90735 RepID=UPI0031F39D17
MFILTGFLCSTSDFLRTYYYINQSMTWAAAQSYCRQKHIDLATIDSKNDVNRLIRNLDPGYSGSAWIGLKWGTLSRWVWSTGEDTLSQYKAWIPGEPSGDGPCAETYNGDWNDLSCAYVFKFVCYNGDVGNVLITTPKNWRDAQSYCRQYHTDLATIHNSVDKNQVYSLAGSGQPAWIGLFADSWQWSDQRSFYFRYWAAGQPTTGDCVAMSTTDSGKWGTYTCVQSLPFICYDGTKFEMYYYYINQSMTWAAAQSYCRQKHIDLATIDSMNDVNRLIRTVDPGYSGSVWIGLKRGTVSRWVWSMGEDTLSQYKAWNTGEPYGDGPCVETHNGIWNDFPCNTHLNFVCYNESVGNVLIKTSKNWRDAQSYCRQYHTDLATIHNSVEQNQVYTLDGSGQRVWIGLFADSWQWSDLRKFYFRYWAAGQPTTGDCVAMSTADSGKLATYICDQSRPFICYDVYQKQVIRLNLSCRGKCNMNDSSLQAVILNERFRQQSSRCNGNEEDVTLSETTELEMTWQVARQQRAQVKCDNDKLAIELGRFQKLDFN